MNAAQTRKAFNSHIKAVTERLSDMNDLSAEMLGLLYRSSLEDNEIPNVGQPTEIQPEVNVRLVVVF